MDRSSLEGLHEDSKTNSPLEHMSTTGSIEGEDSTSNNFSSSENIGQNNEMDKVNTDNGTNIDKETAATREEIQENSNDTEEASKDENMSNELDSSGEVSANKNNEDASGSSNNEEHPSIESENNTAKGDSNQNNTQIDTYTDTRVDTEVNISNNYGKVSQSLTNEANTDSTEVSKETHGSRYSPVENESNQSDVSDNLKEDGLLLANNKSNNTSPEGSTIPEFNEYTNVNKPTKRKRDEILTSYEPIDPNSFQTERSKKRVAGKFIDKFWEPLDSQTTSSLEKILNMCVNRTIEKYKGGTKLSKKMIEAQHILSKTWLNEMDRKSFRSRLNVTNVPLPSTMQSASKSNDGNLDILNYDHLSRRTQFLETYLLAELKQLSDLETYYSDLEMIYNLDLNYLNEFKKTTEINKSKMVKETIAKREKLSLDDIEPGNDDIRLADHTELNSSSFDPNSDKDTQDILQLIDNQLKSLSSDPTNLTNLNEKLETLYNFLYKC